MNTELINSIAEYVESHIGEFHANRIAKLQAVNLKELLSRKNPDMFKAKNKFTQEFIQDYCNANGDIEWEKIVRMNAAIKPPKTSKKK